MDETYIGGEEPGLRGGRARGKKVLTGIAVEVNEPKGIGRCRMALLGDGSAASLHPFVSGHVEPGATVITDAWMGYDGLARLGYAHQRRSQRAARARGDDPAELLPAVHRIASLAKRWLLSTHQGSVEEAHLQSYLDEFVFRFNRRRSRSRGLVFYRLLELAVGHDPVRYRNIVAGMWPRKIPRPRQQNGGIRRAWSVRQPSGRGGPVTWATPVKWRPPNSDTSNSVVSARPGSPHSLTTWRACSRAQGTAESSAPSSRWLEKDQAAGSDRETGPPGSGQQMGPTASDRADTGTGPGTATMGNPPEFHVMNIGTVIFPGPNYDH